METRRNLIIFVILVAVVIVIQGSAEETVKYPCCTEERTENSTGCCICSERSSNCSSLNYNKTLPSANREQCIFPQTTPVYTTSPVYTTAGESTSSVTTILPTTTSVEDEQVFTICLLECPLGFYESTNDTCEPCDELCRNCSSVDECFECKYGRNSTGDCCPAGTHPKTLGNTTICEAVKPESPEPVDDSLYIIIGCVLGGVVVLGILIAVVVCLRCRKRPNGQDGGSQPTRMSMLLNKRKKRDKRADNPTSQLPSVDELQKLSRHPGAYENTSTLDHRAIAQKAQQEQDRLGRYAKDPTGKKKKKKGNLSESDDDVPQETYENQPCSHQGQKKSIFQKMKHFGSKKKYKGMDKKKTESSVEVEPQLEYEDVDSPPPQDNLPTETYEVVEANQQDMPTETYEGVDPSSVDVNMPTEEYTAMDHSTLQTAAEPKPMKQHDTEPGKATRQKKKRGKARGADNPTFREENPYHNVEPASSEKKEDLYENFAVSGGVPEAPEGDYQNYEGPTHR